MGSKSTFEQIDCQWLVHTEVPYYSNEEEGVYMIVWLNGGFGSGKTQTAYELNRRLGNAYVFDPENVGIYMARNLPQSIRKNDFQDYEMWRTFNRDMLKHITDAFDGIIICPMTITNKAYMDEILEGLEHIEIKHFTLAVRKDTLEKRLRSRGEKKGTWPFQQVDRCIQALASPEFKEHIHTDDLSIDQVVETIAEKCDFTLKADHRSKLRKKIDRLMVWKRHFRLVNLFC